MLREFVEQKHYKFAAEAPDWKEAIRMSCESLEADGTIEANYKEDIVACVEKYGPYIVLMPNIAMPHSQEGAEGVHKTSIGFMKLDKPASCNPEQHMNNMVRLSELLMNEEVVAALLKAETPEDLLEIQKQYLD